MYFLSAALSGMRRRMIPSLLTMFGSTALLTAAVAIGMWSYWLGWDPKNVQASRTAAIFVDSTDNSVVEEVLKKAQQVPGVENVRIVSTSEFSAFLQDHFPDLAETLQSLDTDVIPRTLELSLPGSVALARHRQAIEDLTKIPNVARVEDGMAHLAKAFASFHWLSLGGAALGIGLWLVLLILCLGHYQNILYTDAQEIQLIRSFGATKFGILMPWLLEALIQSTVGSVLAMAVLGFGKSILMDLYNQFFGVLGFEPFQMNFVLLVRVAAIVFSASLLAHGIGGVCALFRGKIV